ESVQNSKDTLLKGGSPNDTIIYDDQIVVFLYRSVGDIIDMCHQIVPTAVLCYKGPELGILYGHFFYPGPHFQNFMQFLPCYFSAYGKNLFFLLFVHIILCRDYHSEKGGFRS